MSDAEESAVKAGGKAGGLVTQKHGGAIYQGPPANPVAGTGRPASAIRQALRNTLDKDVLDDLLKKYQGGDVDALGFANFLAKYGLGEDSIAKGKVLALIASWRDVLTKHNAPESMLDELTKVTNEWEMKL